MNAPSQGGYRDIDGKPVTLDALCVREPAWAANRIRSLNAALADMFALIEEGNLVRNTDKDAENGWHMKMLAFVQRLAKAKEQLVSEPQVRPVSQQEGGR